MSEQLKPCPFCGGKATVYYAPGNDLAGIPCFGVACNDCKIMIGTVKDGTTDFYRTPEETAEAWNTRKPVDKLKIMLETCSVNEPLEKNGVKVRSVKVLPLSIAAEIVKTTMEERNDD